jgi:hypothetical protein
VPVPSLWGIHHVERDGKWFLPYLAPAPRSLVKAPDELYLRAFRDTPAGDLDALAKLLALGLVRDLYDRYEDLPIGGPDEAARDSSWRRSLAVLEHELWPGQRGWYGDEAEREQVAAAGPWSYPDRCPPVHAAEVALRVRAMQRTTSHLLAYRAGEPLAPHWRDCQDEPQAWANFIRFTGAALRSFHVRVELEAIDQPPLPEEETTLYSAAMLQLTNDLAADETIHTCANETCGRPYVRQLGRSTYGGHRREGTRYCSSTCARAQYQREKRRRDRAAREDRQR